MITALAKALFNSYTYLEYRKLVSDLLIENKSTGYEQSEDLTHYSSLNDARMNRLDKTINITADNIARLKALKKDYLWIVLSEGWCGDAAQILPILNKMADDSDKKIEMKIVLRDDNDDLMNMFLTNKGKAIPKLIIVEKATGLILDHYGPRPVGANNLVKDYKEKFGVIDEKIKTDLQLWYLNDKGIAVQNEVMEITNALEE